MSPLHRFNALSVGLAVGLGLPGLTCAQTSPSGVNISTGSGAGTSPGVAPGSSPSSTNTTNSNLRPFAPIRDGSQLQPPGTPGISVDMTGPYPTALDGSQIPTLTQEELNTIDARILSAVRTITRPADRAQAMERVARAKIFAHVPGDKRLEDAHTAVAEGGQAALAVDDSVTRDIRLTNLVRTGLLLADEQTREGITDTTDVTSGDTGKRSTARRRFDWLVRAEQERQHAAGLAGKITSSTLRSEMQFRVVDSAAQGSQGIAQAALLADGKRADLNNMVDMLQRLADRSLVFAANDAARIDKPIWRDRAMVSIAIAASASEQFNRGIEICRTIPQPEYRSDALIRLAESQARRNLPDATRTYDLAAQAVASISIDDPRATLASVLIDSLISVGRFDDARACVGFYPDNVRRLNALGTIAENQGERRLTASALAWIDREAPPEIRDQLRLRVSNGVLKAFEKGRGNPNAMGGGTPR